MNKKREPQSAELGREAEKELALQTLLAICMELSPMDNPYGDMTGGQWQDASRVWLNYGEPEDSVTGTWALEIFRSKFVISYNMWGMSLRELQAFVPIAHYPHSEQE